MSSRRDLVVVAGSAGGVEALKRFVGALPPDLPATVLVALHLAPAARSLMPEILRRHTSMPVHAAADGLHLEPGSVVVAQPDSHLLVVDGRVVLGRGAHENGHRPSHDAMLRSAALARGPRTVGVVRTGLLDDGAAGRACVARYGGACLVQDPADAEFPSMPRHALEAVPTATALPLHDLPVEVARTVSATDVPDPAPVPEGQRDLDLAELASALGGSPLLPDGSRPGTPSAYSCPDCAGVLNVLHDPAGLTRFRCRTGHAWSSDSLLVKQAEGVEEALFVALRTLEEREELSRRLAQDATERPHSRQLFLERAEEAARSARALRALLEAEVAADEPGHDAVAD